MLSLIFALISAAPELLPLLDEAFTLEPSIAGIVAAFSSEGALTALGGITFAQWIPIVEDIVAAAPEVQKLYTALHPAIAQIVADLKNGLEVHDAAGNVNAWFKANQPKTISGYGADGSVTDIPNPDAQ